jgi:hypothetical protein
MARVHAHTTVLAMPASIAITAFFSFANPDNGIPPADMTHGFLRTDDKSRFIGT